MATRLAAHAVLIATLVDLIAVCSFAAGHMVVSTVASAFGLVALLMAWAWDLTPVADSQRLPAFATAVVEAVVRLGGKQAVPAQPSEIADWLELRTLEEKPRRFLMLVAHVARNAWTCRRNQVIGWFRGDTRRLGPKTRFDRILSATLAGTVIVALLMVRRSELWLTGMAALLVAIVASIAHAAAKCCPFRAANRLFGLTAAVSLVVTHEHWWHIPERSAGTLIALFGVVTYFEASSRFIEGSLARRLSMLGVVTILVTAGAAVWSSSDPAVVGLGTAATLLGVASLGSPRLLPMT